MNVFSFSKGASRIISTAPSILKPIVTPRVARSISALTLFLTRSPKASLRNFFYDICSWCLPGIILFLFALYSSVVVFIGYRWSHGIKLGATGTCFAPSSNFFVNICMVPKICSDPKYLMKSVFCILKSSFFTPSNWVMFFTASMNSRIIFGTRCPGKHCWSLCTMNVIMVSSSDKRDSILLS